MSSLNIRRLIFTLLRFFPVVLLISFSSQINATLLHDIGYEALVAELGTSTPNGSGVHVSLIEARTTCNGTTGSDCYRPDPVTTTSYIDKSADPMNPTGISNHATGSAYRFYGSTSTSPGITDIDVYAAGHWLGDGYLNSSTVTETTSGTFVINNSTTPPATSTTRVSSHSYVGTANIPSVPNTLDLELLQRMDFLADKDDHVLVVALNNGFSNQPLNGSAYNTITVGRTDGVHPQGTVDVNPGSGLYNSTNRSGPDLVVPESTTSAATPRVASAAALLVGFGHDNPVKSNGVITTRDTSTLQHAETSEVIKASLMAGASKTTSNITQGAANITDYRNTTGNQTTNGLDKRYGAGQLNIQNSYHILAAGEQDAGNVLSTGFDYDASFVGDSTASYSFTNNEDNAWFAASLVWNILFDDNEEEFVASAGTLFDLDLELYLGNSLIASSTSTIDNTENIWSQLAIGDYHLNVISNGVFDHDYGLAWQTAPVPVPAAVWLLGSAIIMLFRTRKSQAVH